MLGVFRVHSEPARPEQKEVLAHVLTNKGYRSTPVLGCPTRKHRRGSNPPPWSMNLAHVIEMITSACNQQFLLHVGEYIGSSQTLSMTLFSWAFAWPVVVPNMRHDTSRYRKRKPLSERRQSL